MQGALEWIGQIASWLGSFIPRWVILDPTIGAVKYIRGRAKHCPGGAVHFYWPVTTLWDTYPVARQTDRLESQTMETADGVTFIVGATITYRVIDIMRLLPVTHLPMKAIIDIAMTAVHDVCCRPTWSELQNEQRRGTLKTKLRNAAQNALSDYGVEVDGIKLVTLARSRVLRIALSQANEEN